MPTPSLARAADHGGSDIGPELYEELLHGYQQGCVFCSTAPELELDRTERFALTFDVAPLTPGHLILHSQEHFACAGEVPEEYFDELESLRDRAARLLRELYGAVTFYEHGRAGHCLSDGPEHRLCHHFHLHLVPGDIEVSETLRSRFEHFTPAGVRGLVKLYEQYGDYLFLESDAGASWYFMVDHEIERHLLRTLIARAIGSQERADWRMAQDPALLREGIAAIRPAYQATRK